ncbi:MAG: zinc ribbon domain-containing protein [Pseudomonadota bacterium]
MPIYEFCCDQCKQTFELLAVQSNDLIAPVCPTCQSPEIYRVLSKINLGGSSRDGQSGPQVSNRNCPSGSCTTIDIPGPSK